MSRWQANLGWGILLALMVGAFWLSWTPSEAQVAAPIKSPAPETLLPADAVLYIGCEGMELHGENFKKTAIYQAVYDSGLMDALMGYVQVLQKQAGDPKELKTLTEIYHALMDHGVSMAVSVSADQGPPMPYGVVVLPNAGKFEPQLSKSVKVATENDVEFQTRMVSGRKVTSGRLPNTPGMELGWWKEGQHLVVAIGSNAVENSIAVAKGDTPNITKHPLWKKYRGADAPEGMTSLSWLDLGSLRKMFGQMPLPPTGEDRPPSTVNGVLKAVGLDSIGAVVSRSGMKGKAMWSESLVETNGPRTGLLAFASDKPLKIDELPPMPKVTLGFHACTVDWAGSYDNAVKTVKNVAKLGPPDAEAQVEGVLANLPAIAGFDPRKDLFQPMGDVTCIYTDGQLGLFGTSVVVAQKINDEKTFSETLANLIRRATAQTTPRELVVAKTKKHGREIVTLQIAGGMFNPSFAVADGWFVAGLIPQHVEAFFLRLDGTLDRWEPNAKHKEAFAELQKEFTGLTVTNPEAGVKLVMDLAPLFVTFAQAAWQDSPQGRQRGPLPISAAALPPSELVAKPLFPNVRVQTVSENGIGSYSRMSVPTVPLMDSGGGAPSVAVAVALLLPAIQKAREAARMSQSKNNLKQLGLAMHNYHETFGHFPAGTHPNEKLKPEQRLSFLADVLPFLDQSFLFEQIEFEEKWDSKDNRKFTTTQIPTYTNPGVSDKPNKGVDAPTHYVGIAGLGKDAATLPAGHKRAGVFGYNRKTRIRDITDGTSNTMMTAEASKNFGAWAAGGNSSIRAFTKKPYINGPDGIGGPWSTPGGHIGMCDGSVRFISDSVDPSVVEALSTMAGGEVVGDF